MGTKIQPGKFDCYDKAKDDEPMFTLLARDPDAPTLIRLWTMIKARHESDKDYNPDKMREARICAQDMDDWFDENINSQPQDAPVSNDRAATVSRLAVESNHAHHGDLSDVPSTTQIQHNHEIDGDLHLTDCYACLKKWNEEKEM